MPCRVVSGNVQFLKKYFFTILPLHPAPIVNCYYVPILDSKTVTRANFWLMFRVHGIFFSAIQ
jgi:hypothetical protein